MKDATYEAVIEALIEKIERMHGEWNQSIRRAHEMHEPREAEMRDKIASLEARLKRKGR